MKSPRDWLAAYASGGLSDDEARRVEAMLAEDPDARAELDELRALIDETRAAQPAPTSEPAWDDMARSIRLAVDDHASSWWSRWWARPVALSGAAAAVGVALYLVFSSGVRTHPEAPAPLADTSTDDDTPAVDVALPDLDDAWNADSIVYELEPDEEFEDMFAFADDDAADDDEPELDFRLAPVHTWLDTLDDDDLEAVEAFLEGTPS